MLLSLLSEDEDENCERPRAVGEVRCVCRFGDYSWSRGDEVIQSSNWGGMNYPREPRICYINN